MDGTPETKSRIAELTAELFTAQQGATLLDRVWSEMPKEMAGQLALEVVRQIAAKASGDWSLERNFARMVEDEMKREVEKMVRTRLVEMQFEQQLRATVDAAVTEVLKRQLRDRVTKLVEEVVQEIGRGRRGW